MEKYGFKKEYALWLYIYIAVNIIAFFIMYNTGLSLGDTKDDPIYNKEILAIASLIVIVSYFVILKPVFNFLIKIRVKRIFNVAPKVSMERQAKTDIIIGVVVLLIEVLYMMFNITEGVNTAGTGTVKSASAWSLFWVLFQADGVFMVYYSFYRNNPLFKYNLTAYLISNILRGWSGMFLFVIFMEWCLAVRNKKIKIYKMAIVSLVFLVLYPLLLNMKWVIRSFEGDSSNLPLFYELFMANLVKYDYSEWLMGGLEQVVSRLQQTSILMEVIHFKDILNEEFNRGAILPFWSDGVLQIGFRRLMGITAPPNIGVAFTDHLHPKEAFDLGSWNVSVGYTAWFFVVPALSWLYLLYTGFLCFLSVFLIKQLPRNEGSIDLIWYAWLVYVLAGWVAQFVGFLYAIFVFIMIRLLAQQLARITFRQKSKKTNEQTLSSTTIDTE
jgi:hypothetical protein